MEFIDTHSHYCDEAFTSIQDETIERCQKAGVSTMLQADTGSDERDQMYELCRRHPGCLRPMLGIYPGNVNENWKEEMDKMLAWTDKGAVAIGEIGLDYHEGKEYASLQQDVLRLQLDLAREMDLPVNIHLRDATEDFLKVMKDPRYKGMRGNLHAFSGSVETFEQMNRLGDWYVGIGGVLTFKNASLARDICRIPLERIVLETDAPYLSPTPLRGTLNESSNIPLIAAKLAEIKDVPIQNVAEITTSNARRLFNL